MAASTAERDLAAIPGPRGGLITGAGVMLWRDLLDTLLSGMHRYGDVVRYEVMPSVPPLHTTIVVAHHPDDVRTVLTQTEHAFSKRTVGFRVLTELIGHGLLTTEGEVWRTQRRTVQPLFTRHGISRYAAFMAEEAARLPIPPGGMVDLDRLTHRYTLRVVGRTLFSDDIDDVVPALQRLMPRLSGVAVRRTFQPIRLPHWIPTPGNLALRRVRAEEYAIVDRILDRPMPGDRDDLVSRLRTARDPHTGQPLTRQEIRDQILVFLLAGHETTANALTATLYLLGRHPSEQERVAAEATEVLDGRGAPSPEDLPALVWTRAALREGLRLYPPAYLTERITTKPVRIGGYQVPPGVMVLVAPWTTHRHPEWWPEPERFQPARFVGSEDRPHYAYFPFGGGPRGCIGEHFALLEATIVLATLLARYRVTASGAELRVRPLVTLRPAGPVTAWLDPR